MTFTTSHFDQVISLPHYMNADNGNPRMCSTGEEMSHRVLQIFEDLNKQLRNLSQLPLAVTSVVGTSPVFRHTEVCSSNPPYCVSSFCVICKVFPPVPWTGRFRSHLASTSFSEDDSIQSQCLYPNPDHATPPYVHALNGTRMVIVILLRCIVTFDQWYVNWSQVASGLMKQKRSNRLRQHFISKCRSYLVGIAH